ncbi:branched-chain amino acid ABC transporter substrate-binding protein [Ensifer sp. ENS03]|uniref:branched-chain amino acid ABC transporter substrate-binding protein n=1 Tax=Ensifer sp. ENS03 TaxID=2769283 RepID=UPI0017823BBC|nr:branched-chain amino acid ABC transporter substrate-binding protein [Ensifer sp. ENS03]MBD9560661.1 branched-chain amino acid ABC transporter substrate-binding protein [Ensifer sp. ENS03]
MSKSNASKAIGAAFFALTLFASSGQAELIVAVIAPLKIGTPFAAVGRQMKAGAEQAIADVNAQREVHNAAGVGRKLDLLVLQLADDECQVALGKTIANQVANQGVPLIVGHFCSSVSVEAGQIYKANGALQIVPFSSMPSASSSSTLFRLMGTLSSQAGLFVNFVKNLVQGNPDLSANTDVAIIVDRSPYGEELGREIVQQLKVAGVDMPALPEDDPKVFTLKENTKNAALETATELVDWGPEVVFLGGYHPEMDVLTAEIKSRLPNAKLFLSDLNVTSAFVNGAAGMPSNPPVMIHPANPVPDSCGGNPAPANCAVKARIATRLGGGPQVEPSALFAYAAIEVWAKAEATQPNPWSVGLTLESNDFPSVLGLVGFQNGDTNDQQFYFFTWTGNKLTPFSP